MMPSFIKRLDVRISLLYGVVATLWIVFSDTLALLVFGNNHSLEAVINIGKGLGFVVVTGLALYLILSIELRKRARVEQQLVYERDISPVAIIIFSVDGRISYANLQAEKLLGQPRSGIIGKSFNSPEWHVSDFDGKAIDVYALIAQLAHFKQPIFGSQLGIEVVKGQRILLEFNLAPIFDIKNAITGVVATFNDVTSAKNLEKRLRESEERFRLLFNNNPLPMIVYDPDTEIIIEVNDAVVTQYGYSCAELLTMHLDDIRLPDDAPQMIEDTHQKRTERQHRLKNGQIITVEVTSHVIEYADRYAVLAIAQNISRRKLADHALRASEASLKHAQSIAHLGDWMWDVQNNQVHWSDEMYRIFGFDQSMDISDMNAVVQAAVHPDDRTLLLDSYKTVINDRKGGIWEYRIVWPDGSIHYVWSETTTPVMDSEGNILSVSGITQDITERKRAEQALRESESSLKRAQAIAHVADWSWDSQSKIMHWSDEMYSIFNVDQQTFSGDLNKVIVEAMHPDDREWGRQINSAIMHGQKGAWEFRIVRSDGSVRYIQIESGENVVDAENNVLKLSGIMRDITEQKRADQALRESEASLKRAQAVAHVGSWSLDIASNTAYASEEAYRIFGVDGDISKANLNELIIKVLHPDDQMPVIQAIGDILKGQKATISECRIIWPDHSVHHIWVELGEIHRDSNGTILALSGIVQDITERKQAEKALQESESRYRNLIEQASDAIFIAEADSNYIEVNSAACHLLGYTHDEILQKKMQEIFIIPPDKPLRYAELAQGKTLLREREMIRKDGSLVSVEVSSKLLLDGTVQLIARDITERKQAEEELRLKSAALEAAANGIVITNIDGIIEWVNPAFAALTGYEAEEAEGNNPGDLIQSGQHNKLFYKEMWDTILTGQVWRGELVNRRKNGSMYTEEMTITPLRNELGEIQHFIGIKQDITERKLSEAAIHKLNTELEARVIERTRQLNLIKNRIESILNSNADSIIFSRVDGTIEQINPAFTQTFGYRSDEILLQPLQKLVTADDVSELEEVFASVVINRQVQQVDVIATRKNGKIFDAAVLLSPVIENKDELVGVVLNVHDVTSRNHMLRHAMDLTEIKSRYVSMAAHDLRNPMAVILSSSETLEHYYDKMNAEKKQAKFEQIKASIKVMTDILDDVLIMGQAESGKLQFRPAPLDLTAFCEMLTAEMVQATKSTLQIDLSIEGIKHPVMMDAKLLRHILGNLLSNAIKYSPNTDQIIFSVHGHADRIEFRVQDHGIGIPKTEQSRLFETFHRASNAKHIHGTGLGLAIVKQSVELHGGSITFESEEGNGSTFIVTLPIES